MNTIKKMRYRLHAVLLAIGMLCCCLPLTAQTTDGEVVVGKVYSKSDGELIGVSIREFDATKRVLSGTVTDINGEFSMKIKSPKNRLIISYVGYKEVSLTIGDKRKFSIQMEEDDKSLDEVVVTAKRQVNTGSMLIPEREVPMAMQTLKADFAELSVASLDEALQGQIAGLDIVANSGDVGAGSAMRLRGTATINANTTPLILLNDLVYDAGNTDNFDFVGANNESFANLLAINVDDIESITVMKDGAASAIYGSKAANGIISIYTKRGKRGKPRVSYTYRLSGIRQPEGLKMLNGDEYTMFLKEAFFNPTYNDAASSGIPEINYLQNDADFPDWRMYDNNTDWINAVKTTGIRHNHYITLSGGGEKARFYLSGGYYNETGSIICQGLNRYTTRMDLEYDVSDRIRFRAEMTFTHTDEDKNLEDLLATAYKKMPNLGIYREDSEGNATGEYYTIARDMSPSLDDQKRLNNPIAVANLGQNEVKSFSLNPTFRLTYDLLPYDHDQMLRMEGIVSFGINNNSTLTYRPKELSSAVWTNDQLNKWDYGSSKNLSTSTHFNLRWKPRLNKDHSVISTGSLQVSTGSSASQSENSYGVPSGVGSPTTGSYVSGMGSSTSSWRDLALVMSSHYSYKSKYSFAASLRYEGDSKFGPNRKFGTFYGLSARWNLIDETFMEPTWDWMSMLALRASTGLTGTGPSKNYLHFSKYESWSSYLGQSTVRPVSIRLNDLRWEKTRDYNYGLDLGFFEDLITANFNYYDKKTSDLLHEGVAIPTTSGFSTVEDKDDKRVLAGNSVYTYANVGSVLNEGWDLHIDVNRFIKAGKFSASVNFNFANNRNTVLELSDIILQNYNGDYDFNNGTYMSRLQLGNSIGSIYGFRSKGVYQYGVESYSDGRVDKETGRLVRDLVDEGLVSMPVARDANGRVILTSEGKPVPMYFGYGTSAEVAFQGGDAIYEDINNDGNINELDIVYLGNSNPKLNGGFGIKLFYDRLSLNIYSVFRYGNKIVNAARMDAESMSSVLNQSVAVKWRWRKEGDLTTIPRALNGNSHRNSLGSDRYVEDGSFWRIRQLSLNYSFPNKTLSKWSITAANLFLTVDNLYCFTNYSGVDPEVGYGSWGVSKDGNKTPRSQSFNVGFSVTF